MKHVDRYIYLDNVQYIKGGWINRNRILKPNCEWQYINVPIKKFRSYNLINEINIIENDDWKKKIISQLQHYKKKAPYYLRVIHLLENLFNEKYSKISILNQKADELVCEYLDIKTPINVLSKMDLNYNVPRSSDEWGLNICKALTGVTEYWNAPGGKEFFNLGKYEKERLKVCFIKQRLSYYDQLNGIFQSGLSILDVMMFNSQEQINEMLDDYIILE